MIERMLPSRERLDHLLADRALFGLSQRDNFELESLVADFPETDTDCFDRIAACVDLALGPGRFEPLSDSLQAVIRTQAADHLWPNSMGDL
jgi:hypothetical protein